VSIFQAVWVSSNSLKDTK